MRRNALSIAVGLTLVIGLLLVSGVAWAQAEKQSVNYLLGDCNDLAEPEREWVDEEGIRHIRDVMYRCERRRQISGVEIGWYSGDIDLAGDHRFFRAYYSFTGLVLNEPATGVGRVTEECNRIEGVWNCTGRSRACGTAPVTMSCISIAASWSRPLRPGKAVAA
jgi:hypothetical protein